MNRDVRQLMLAQPSVLRTHGDEPRQNSTESDHRWCSPYLRNHQEGKTDAHEPRRFKLNEKGNGYITM